MSMTALNEMTAQGPRAALIAINDEGCDARLVESAKCGELTAFDEIVRRYKRRMLHCAESITRNHADAEEVVQEAFLRAFSNLDRFRGESRLFTWIVRITVNQALMRIRSRRANIVSIDRNDENDTTFSRQIKFSGPNPEQSHAQREFHKLLITEVERLKPIHRLIVQLLYIQEFSVEETAMALGMSNAAVKSASHRARLSLRHALSRHLPGRMCQDNFKTHRPRSLIRSLEKRSA